MDYEKAYKEAIERASKIKLRNPIERIQDEIDSIFPELQESENERIRKEIIEFLIWIKEFRNGGYEPSGKYVIEDMIAWLEKQGEQKPADKSEPKFKVGDWIVQENIGVPATKEQRDLLFQKMKEAGYEWDSEKKKLRKMEQNHTWSEEDTDMIDHIIRCLKRCGGDMVAPKQPYQKEIDWLKSIKPQPKQEWSEEDEWMLNKIIRNIEFPSGVTIYRKPIDEMISWLKSLKPQNHWKPSEEQMKHLKSIAVGWHPSLDDCRILSSLYNDLLKL